MIPMPGPTPLRGDALTVLVSGTRCTVTGEVSLRGVLRGGRGYIGESTSREIDYARATGKPISFTDPAPAAT